MDVAFQILLALYAFGLGRVPWRYYIPLTIPLLVLAYMAALYYGASWLLVYAAFILYLFPLSFVIFFLNFLVGAAYRAVAGPDAKLPKLVRDALVTAAALAIVLIITHLVFGLPRVAAYFLGGLVGKEPLRAFDLGYYFSSWPDVLRAVPALAAYVFFFLFARGALYRLGGEVKPPPDAKYDSPPPMTPNAPPPRTKRSPIVFIIVCVYVLPTLLSLGFMLYTGGFGQAGYNALGLDDDGRRVLWADVNGDGRADPILAGGTYANPDAFAVALDGRTGDTIWYADLPGEWCSASPQAGGDLGFFLTQRPHGAGGEIIALELASGELRWRRVVPAGAAALNRGTAWERRGDMLLVPIDYERALAINAADGRVISENARFTPAAYEPEPYLEYGDGGAYYYREADRRRYALRVGDFFRQFSPYYSFRLSEYRPSGFDLLWTGDGTVLISMPDKYYYGLVIPAWVDALFSLDPKGAVRWELADGRLHDVEAVAGVSDDLVLIIGRGPNRRPLLAGVSPRTGAILWTWNRPLGVRERIARQWEYFTGMYSF